MTLPQPVMLYDTARAPNPRRVRIFLAEKGVSLPTTEIDIMAGQHFDKAYRGKVGSHNVPALELDDGTFLTETVAICRYLEAIYPDNNLLGDGPLEQSLVEMWSRRIETHLMMPIAFVARHGIAGMQALEREQCPAWSEHNVPRVAAGLRWFEKCLGDKSFIAGDRFTLADITAFCTLDFMRLIRTPIPEENLRTHAWRARCKARGTIVS
ncbi:glutathione S-transferase family protein [Pontivivens insulae]|uniref:Glutathione S-transferase n=1 Tax=Pontivivens insulae TaxID=1639689 RepID=A0A2R8A7C1_9RHOB|nr:glutathione S-transferase [Pontivivens insulae]RED18198.1 glutathione S-transferase [Pontivivens insulae]SPF28096.1 Glutathione S-transferase [Pontivivens insulae]